MVALLGSVEICAKFLVLNPFGKTLSMIRHRLDDSTWLSSTPIYRCNVTFIQEIGPQAHIFVDGMDELCI